MKALAALAQSTRLQVFRLIVQQGTQGLSASSIADKLSLPNPTLSFHLKELSQASLVNARQEGRFIYYAANYATMNELVAYLTLNCCSAGECVAVPQTVKPATSKRKSA